MQVAQHGIRAILPGGLESGLKEELGDISGGDATWKAWKLVELHTAQVRVFQVGGGGDVCVIGGGVSLLTNFCWRALVFAISFSHFTWLRGDV
jgi:hypothetical protein